MPPVGPNGIYALQGHEDCTTPYTGRNRNQSVFIIGFGTEHERLFARKDNRAAVDYAKATKPAGTSPKIAWLMQVHSTQICDEAARSLFGETS